jgi:hypothetical protein
MESRRAVINVDKILARKIEGKNDLEDLDILRHA